MATTYSPDELGQKISQLHQEFVTAYKERFSCENKHAAVIKCSPIWQKLRKEFKAFPQLKSQINQRLFPKVEPPFLMIWIQSGQVFNQLLSYPRKRLT